MKTAKFARVYLFLCLLFSYPLFSEESAPIPKTVSDIEEYASLIDFEGMPNTIVDGCVNVLTGNYFESADDFVGPGPSPITVSRYFDSGSAVYSELRDLWDLNIKSLLKKKVTEEYRDINISDRGTNLLFRGKRKSKQLEISAKILEEGVVNICSPYASGKHHLLNKRVHILKEKKKKRYLLKSPGWESLLFTKEKGDSHYLLRTLFRPNGCKLDYFYEKEHVKRIESLNNEGQLSQAIGIARENDQVTITADDGREIVYTLSKMKSQHRSGSEKHRYCLTKVNSNFGPTVKYEYKKKGDHERDLLIRRELPDNRYKKIVYHISDKKNDKVKYLYAPVGVGTEPIRMYRFDYHSNKAEVFDAYKNRKTFRWTKEKRISLIEEWSPQNKIYRSEQLFWGKKETKENSFLKARALKNGKGEILLARTYRYDDHGNILEECLAGNLSGSCKASPKIKSAGVLAANGCETFVKTYTYDNNNLVISENDGCQKIFYIYYPNTSLIELKTVVGNEQIRQRYYYEYDSESCLTLEVIDDGSSHDINNLDNVSERHIKRIETTKNNPKGLPRVVSEFCYNKTLGKEELIKRTVNTFTPYGQLAREEVYDSNNTFAYSKEWLYDSQGNAVEEKDPAGRRTYYKYDANKNCICNQTANLQYKTNYLYDFANRLIKKEEIHSDGNHFVKSYSYDFKGNRTRTTDIYGNVTLFEYDYLGRLVKRILPPIPGLEGKLVCPQEVFSYNELNHPKEKTDADGCLCRVWTNLYGNPYRIENADGTVETFLYNPDGTIKEAVDKDGTKTVFQYDYQKRTISEEKFSSENALLSSKKCIYNAFHLLQEIDPEGVVTTYTYDSAGRKSSERKDDAEILYFYDSLGRESERWELCSDHDYRVEAIAYDILDRIIEERVQTPSGEVLFKKQYGYDVNDNRTHETVFTEAGQFTTVTCYNTHGQPLSVTAPDETETLYVYNYDYRDEWNLSVPYEETIDPLGNVSITVMNTHDGIALEETKNCLGETVQKTKSLYNARGNLLHRIEEIIINGKTERSCTTAFTYDSMRRETTIMEAYGAPEQKITRKEYSNIGEISRIFKPDGVILEHSYDSLGRLILLTSSDDSIHYEYGYNHNNNVLWAKDCVEDTLTERTFDFDGRMRTETLDNGLQFEYSYDPMGRLTEFLLPDSSIVFYRYDPGYVREVSRENNGTVMTHRYYYDLSGKLIRSELMNGLGEIHYSYDSLLRLTELYSDYWRMQGEYDPCGNLSETVQSDRLGKNTNHYLYDSLQQLTAEEGWEQHTYPLDSLGNRVAKDGTPCTTNLLNQLKKQGDTSYNYDLNGNLTEKSGQEKTLYTYDALDRLVEVVVGGVKTAYHYDPFHRRTKKYSFIQTQGEWKKNGEESYLYQAEKEIGMMDEEGTLQQLRILGIGCKGDVGAAVLMEIAGETYVPLHDYRGDVVVILEANTGRTVEMYRYTAYGEERIYGSKNLLKSSAINPWRFSSKRVDPETGWSFFGRRYYDPEVGRWTTPDPLWYVDGSNLYCYVKNRPTQFIDPEGLFLDALWEIAKVTFASFIEAFSGVDFNLCYDEGSGYVCVDTPTTEKRRRGFDQQSHRFRQKGAKYGQVYVTSVNGIGNSLEDSQSNYAYAANMAEGCSGCGVYNATHGAWDSLEAFANICLGIRTKPADLLAETWRDYFNNCPEDGIIIHCCHSQGTAHTKGALALLDPELRERVHVIAVAPSSYIDRELCGSVKHLVSRWDIVPWIDVIGRWRNRDTITLLDRHPSAGYFDHPFQSPTYEKTIRNRIRRIREEFGDLKP